MSKDALEAAQITPQEPDNSGEIETIEQREHLDPGNVVVPIRKGIERVVLENKLAQLEKDLGWKRTIVNSSLVNDSPEWSGRVKSARRSIPLLERDIAQIKAEIAELK